MPESDELRRATRALAEYATSPTARASTCFSQEQAKCILALLAAQSPAPAEDKLQAAVDEHVATMRDEVVPAIAAELDAQGRAAIRLRQGLPAEDKALVTNPLEALERLRADAAYLESDRKDLGWPDALNKPGSATREGLARDLSLALALLDRQRKALGQLKTLYAVAVRHLAWELLPALHWSL